MQMLGAGAGPATRGAGGGGAVAAVLRDRKLAGLRARRRLTAVGVGFDAQLVPDPPKSARSGRSADRLGVTAPACLRLLSSA